ncbi:hypothetical protein EDD11_003520 [Mortierella claussenii]|nr:hypothetical protein EDD11_003520 [Mortierella claussenii]
MASDTLTLFCLISGERLSTAFPVEVLSSKTVGALKNAIKLEKATAFEHIDANDLVLWKATVPTDENAGTKRIVTHSTLDNKTELDNPRTSLSKLFPESLDDDTYIIVEQPKPKRETMKKIRQRLSPTSMKRAIAAAGLTEKAVVNGNYNLSLLNNKEKVALLGVLGQEVGSTDRFNLVAETAVGLRTAQIAVLENIKAPSNSRFPVVQAGDLFVRQSYKELYGPILTNRLF